ncbi:hypothetical protein DD595_24810 [Enterobacter cloacae complex sp. 4DZ3-17B2]|uniref:C2H2-type zinc finger protein n=1 Tax=Enterobacter cloacae complex sp. 4DZ3-17B2 TaxID=2511990 RepID=UPI0010108FD4|nr:C2H2-type zinc finger protein [Enterobacter cloacae complex sp. 4DZ3-17B2]RYA73852.1 hypothetical protein DD595_24810 [Enterobacter cloacae complex sp. 4DZ3-17B2]
MTSMDAEYIVDCENKSDIDIDLLDDILAVISDDAIDTSISNDFPSGVGEQNNSLESSTQSIENNTESSRLQEEVEIVNNTESSRLQEEVEIENIEEWINLEGFIFDTRSPFEPNTPVDIVHDDWDDICFEHDFTAAETEIFQKPQALKCEDCRLLFKKNTQYQRHLKSRRHLMNQYRCNRCNLFISRKDFFSRLHPSRCRRISLLYPGRV